MFTLSVVLCCILAVTAATDVQQCSGYSFENLQSAVQLTPCKKLPCKLKRGTDQHIAIRFTPDKDIEEIRNEVGAELSGIYLPFFGVDGTSACGKLETENGEKASCPVKAGTTYIFKDSFPILSLYPTTELKVHWALNNGNKKVICFEVPAKIVK